MFAEVSFWNITVGIVGGLLAALFGLIDWLAIPRGTTAQELGLWHGLGNLAIVLLFLASWLLLGTTPTRRILSRSSSASSASASRSRPPGWAASCVPAASRGR